MNLTTIPLRPPHIPSAYRRTGFTVAKAPNGRGEKQLPSAVRIEQQRSSAEFFIYQYQIAIKFRHRNRELT
jgi:hypothetical protein